MGETGTDGEELPPWPPVSPAVTDLSEAEPDSEADTGELPLVPAAPESAVATAPPLDATLPPDATRPPDATPPERNLTRLAILGGLTVLLIIAAMLIVTPAHRPARSATDPVPAPAPAAPGTTAGGPGSSTAGGGPSGSAGTTTAGARGAGSAGAAGPSASAPSGVPGEPGQSPPPQTPPPGALAATMSIVVHAGGDSGYQANVVITNQSDAAVTGWQLVVALAAGETVSKVDGAVFTQDGTAVTFTPKDTRQALHPGQKIPVRFEVKGGTAAPTGCTVNGSPCG